MQGKLRKYRIKEYFQDMDREEKRQFLDKMTSQLGLTQAMIYMIMNYEHGEGRNATPHQLQVFAGYFNCTIEDLLVPSPEGSTVTS